ncbi:D-proline reductase (dithiol) PrdE [Halanaerobium sp. MA284_MarDTE_T2]|nr:D-proline reductase (dithiol) PrdE [Halanaerobium sp. MA284_MarDTE_T2]RCW84916.1 D-proline reductase (dithiol) PrdE [Halanaerobium sp. DL-01]
MGIGPSTKETSLHHFRDPLLNIINKDEDINLMGVIIVGTPQSQKEKYYVGKRAAQWAEAMQVDGAIVSADGWGNSDVDFANTIKEIAVRDIEVVGLSFIGIQGKFVVKNRYMDTIIDINKSESGIETEVVGENTVDELDAKKALAFLKLKMKR